MKKFIVFIIIGAVIFFVGCASQPDVPIENDLSNNEDEGPVPENLYEQISEEAVCPCNSRFNLNDCREYVPDCEHLPVVDNIINDMISKGESKDQILKALDEYNEKILEDKLNKFKESQAKDNVILIYFKSEICQLCVEKEPVINEIRDTYRGKIDMYEFDAMADRPVFEYFGVIRVPSIIFFDGKERLNETPFTNISIDLIGPLIDYTLDKKN